MRFSKLIYSCAALSTLIFSATSCEDNASEVGSSLINDQSEVVIDSLFTITGHAMPNTSVLSRTTLQLLGAINAEEYGDFGSGFVTQFLPSQTFDTTGVSVNDIDSVKMLLFIRPGGFTGDSIVPMGLTVYKLNRQLPSSITSDFDPTGYYDETPWASAMYSANALHDDSIASLSFRTINVDLPVAFGRSLYQQYLTNPSTFVTPQQFAQFFPGVYVKSTFGSGRVMNIVDTRVNLYYRRHAKVTGNDGTSRDTTYNQVRSYLAVTPEVITDNLIRYTISPQLQTRIDAGESIIAAPAGTEVQLTFPAQEIINEFRSKGQGNAVLNTVSLKVGAEPISNKYGIKPPENVLFILSSEKQNFFANSKLPDEKTSFTATYDEKTQSYNVADMRDYILMLLDKDVLTPEDYTFTVTPVDIVTETTSSGYYQQSYVTGVNPYVSTPALVRLRFDNAKIKVTYSMQSINN